MCSYSCTAAMSHVTDHVMGKPGDLNIKVTSCDWDARGGELCTYAHLSLL
jgi:hypothetical protein